MGKPSSSFAACQFARLMSRQAVFRFVKKSLCLNKQYKPEAQDCKRVVDPKT